jgi:hypothetical protein
MKKNFRIGINLGGLLRNAGVFVIAVEPTLGNHIVERMGLLKEVLILAGHGDIASKLVAEFRNG